MIESPRRESYWVANTRHDCKSSTKVFYGADGQEPGGKVQENPGDQRRVHT